MIRTAARRSIVLTTLLVGGVVLGAFVAVQAGLVPNIFSTKDAAPRSAALNASADRAPRAAVNKRRVNLGQRLGQSGAKQAVASQPVESPPSGSRPSDSPSDLASDRLAQVAGTDRNVSWQPAIMPFPMINVNPGLRSPDEPAIEYDLPPHGNAGGSAAGIGSPALASAGGNLAQTPASRLTAPGVAGRAKQSASGSAISGPTASKPETSARESAPAAPVPLASRGPETQGVGAPASNGSMSGGPAATSSPTSEPVAAVAAPTASGIQASSGTGNGSAGSAPVDSGSHEALAVTTAPAGAVVAAAAAADSIPTESVAEASGGAPAGTPPGGPTSFVQTEGRTVVNGVLTRDLVDIQGGYLGGSGVIQGNVIIGAAAMMNPGNSPGTLTVIGDLTFGNLVIEIVSLSLHDLVDISGTANFIAGSQLLFKLDSSSGTYVPTDGADFEFLRANALAGLENLNYSISGLPGGFSFRVYADSESDLHVRFSEERSGTFGTQAFPSRQVPEPSTTVLGLLGLTLLAWLRQRRVRVVRRI